MFKVNDTTAAIQLTRGDTAKFSVTVTDEVSKNDYVMAEGDTLTLTVKKSCGDCHIYFQKKIVGSAEFHITPEDTKRMQFGEYVYDVQLNTAEGDVYTIITPTVFEIMPEVTTHDWKHN